MKYDSVHKFKSIADALVFVEASKKGGFRYKENEKDGGIVLTNDKGYTMMVCVAQ